jgi:hypothetical protein
MVERRNIEFRADGGAILRGWLFVPAGAAKKPHAAITTWLEHKGHSRVGGGWC